MPRKNDFRSLEDEELHIVHTYVILNYEESGPSLECVQSHVLHIFHFSYLKKLTYFLKII